MTKLTDRKIAELLNNIAIDYQSNPYEIHDFVYYLMQPGGIYCDLDTEEKEKVWKILDIFLDAICESGRQTNRPARFDINQNYSRKITWAHHRYSYHTFVYVNSSPCCYHHNNGYHHHHGSSSGHFSGGHSHTSGEEIVIFFVIVCIAIITLITLASMVYLARQALNDLDRIWYNEGRFQAVVSLALMAGTGVAVGMLIDFALTGILASFLLSVGFANPVALALFTVFCLTTIATAFLNPLGQLLQRKATELLNQEAIDPSEPSRFTLTSSEAQRLESNGIDPIRVKCAIAALHVSLNGKETTLYNQFSLFKSRSPEVQAVLTQIRQLRSGELDTVQCGNLHFNCKKTDYIPTVACLVSDPIWATATVMPEPSAPSAPSSY